MRARVIRVAVAVAVVAALGTAFAVTRSDGDPAPSTPLLEEQTVSAGAVDIKLEPHHVDATGAQFRVTLDTHSEDLDMDLVAGARLTVDGTTWPAAEWDGAGPSGHHRAGDLRFDAAGPANGAVHLTLDGFPAPVAADWQLEDSGR